MNPSNRRGHKDWWYNKHNTLYSGAIIYLVDYSSILRFRWLLNYFIKPNHLLVFDSHSLKRLLMFRPSGQAIVMRLVERERWREGRQQCLRDGLLVPQSSGLAAQQGSLSCGVVSCTSLKIEFDYDSTRRSWVRLLSGGRILKDEMKFFTKPSNLFYFSLSLDQLKVVTV